MSTELGTTNIFSGGTNARKERFSLLQWLTVMQASHVSRFNFKALLRWIEAASAKEKREWSVKTFLNPNV